MCLRWSKHPNAPVGALPVVELDEPPYALPCLLDVAEAAGGVDEFLLDDAVDTFSNCVVRGIVVLRHAYQCTAGLQLENVGIGTILDAPVGMVDQSRQVFTRLPYSLHQGLHGVASLQAFRETPAHDLVGVGIRYQMQIAAVLFNLDVGNVTDPQGI